MRLKNRTILVTGASKGIGRALAVGLAREGARVAVNYHSDAQGAEETVKAIRAAGREAMSIQADVGRLADIDDMMKEIDRRWGTLDGLINNAGVTGWTSLFETTEEQWNRVIDTNLKGTFFTSLAAARMMKDRKGGTIVNISTNIAALGVLNLSAYAASKGGVHALTRQMAVELAPHGIRVNTFAPGPTLVERNLKDDPDYNKTWGEVVPLGRAAQAEEMVGAAVFLSSDESSFMTGQIFYVDGGWTIAGRSPQGYFESAMENQGG